MNAFSSQAVTQLFSRVMAWFSICVCVCCQSTFPVSVSFRDDDRIND